ncbi:MAG: PDZ domain-containing protein [Deltaproteobacteria bacterium]|nr:PDZ domain-containing protein [Deltaproteobacteria bacterium]
MKRCGRSNKLSAVEDQSQRCCCPSLLLDRGRGRVLLIFALVTFAIGSLAEPVPAANRAGAFSRPLADAAVHVSSNFADPYPATILASDALVPQSTSGAAATTEIPPAVPSASPTHAQPATTNGDAPAPQAGSADYDDGIIRYEHAKDANISGPPIGTLDDFMSGGDITSPLGFEVREDRRRLKGGGEAQGLLIMGVVAGSPAAHAGLRAYHRVVRDVLETAAVAGAMLAPPVVLLVPVFDQVRLGESYDLIIGVDGSRVAYFLDFQDRLRDVQPGEIVYFSIIRNGERMQIPVPVPSNFANPAF